MVTICCTLKLLKRTGLTAESLILDPTTALGNWHASILFFYHTQILLFVNDNSRLAVITPAVKARSLGRHLTHHLSILLKHLNVPPKWIDAEVREMAETRIGATRSRSVLGTMNDYKVQIEGGFDETGGVDPLDMSLRLSECPVGPLQYRVPGEVSLDLLRERYESVFFG